MSTPPSPKENHLLAALPAVEFERIAPYLELVAMPLGKVLYETGDQLHHVCFPTTAIVSLRYLTENGGSAEVAEVGSEGALGIPLCLGGDVSRSQAIVCGGGHGYRLTARILMEEFRRAEMMQHLLLRYVEAMITQASQTAVCNRLHSVEQQLNRWLLLTLDRLPSNELTVTQELIASMIGVRRECITEAAGHLQQAGYIRYRRGHITVLDRAGLESHVCECYKVVKSEFDRLLCDV